MASGVPVAHIRAAAIGYRTLSQITGLPGISTIPRGASDLGQCPEPYGRRPYMRDRYGPYS